MQSSALALHFNGALSRQALQSFESKRFWALGNEQAYVNGDTFDGVGRIFSDFPMPADTCSPAGFKAQKQYRSISELSPMS